MNLNEKTGILKAAGLACCPLCVCVDELAGMLSDEALKKIAHITDSKKAFGPLFSAPMEGASGMGFEDLFGGLDKSGPTAGVRRPAPDDALMGVAILSLLLGGSAAHHGGAVPGRPAAE